MSVRSAGRALDLVEWLSTQASPAPLNAVAHALDLPKSSALLLLRTLVERGYAERQPDGRYALTRLPGEPVAGAPAWGSLIRIAEPILRETVAVAGETGFLAVLTPECRIRYALKILPQQREIRYDRDISRDRTVHHVASGLAILSALPDAEAETYMRDCADEAEALRVRLADIRARGVAVNLNGRIEGASGVACAVLDIAGRPLAAVNLAGPSARVAQEMDELCALAREAASRIGAELARRHPRQMH